MKRSKLRIIPRTGIRISTLNPSLFEAKQASWSLFLFHQCLIASQVPASLGRPGVVKDDGKTAFVRNLPFRASEADITDFFAQAGPVADVRRQADDQGGLRCAVPCCPEPCCAVLCCAVLCCAVLCGVVLC